MVKSSKSLKLGMLLLQNSCFVVLNCVILIKNFVLYKTELTVYIVIK